MTRFRYILWAAVFLLGSVLAYSTVTWTLKNQQGTPFGVANIGGPFEAITDEGMPITHEAMKGKPHVLFFGFTHCPDVGPTTLYEATQWYKELGDGGDNLDMYFVTVDPARDTATVLNDYLSGFDQRIQGITGTENQMADMTKKWRVFAQKVPTDDDYTMNHTATTFLMAADGSFVSTIAYGEDNDVAVAKLRKLIGS